MSNDLNDGSSFIRAKQSSKPALHGWAPGWYVGKCNDCGCYFQGDKRACQCADCAYSSNDEKPDEILWIKRSKENAAIYAAVNGKLIDWITQGRPITIELGPIDRVELIDHTKTMEGRTWVRGSIYESPVEVELDVQDEGRTLKIFVRDRE